MAEELVPIFRVTEAHAAAEWYARLGFELLGTHQFEPGFPLYAFLRRGDIHLHLSEHTGDAPHHSVCYFYVDDVDAIAAEFDVPVTTAPWAREVHLTDPDGNRLRIGTVAEPG